MHQDLNDLYYFVQVVEHGGFTQAGRALGIPKSKLSRRIALLEERQEVRLIQRTTRRFVVTELGQAYYERCKDLLQAAEAAQSVLDDTHAVPCGTVRISCPIALLQALVGNILVDFSVQYPEVTIQLVDINRPVDVVGEGLDVSIRVRPLPLEDSDLAMRSLGYARQYLVASPTLVEKLGAPKMPAELANWPSLANGRPVDGYSWKLLGPNGAAANQHHQPKLITTDMLTLRQAAIAGIGVVQLPEIMVYKQLQQGELVRLLEDWSPPKEIIHAIFPTKRGLPPAVRLLIDFLAERFREMKMIKTSI
ncbi:LysR family transcriptional regulator [Motiliproteus sp. MSK22-1]|uniref:LysR family transcriptional regulator n=1 Tax=Motiliproteus sp. MSK22-1 TaxID=1897630 RepID=UPI0009755699|nr:LysR family transcriptional regulator [Motiliproteus sp. MSK22-1]OMH32667.1 LysR family transcriptional regulator [Motiliproteus sp. MSK22-1]